MSSAKWQTYCLGLSELYVHKTVLNLLVHKPGDLDDNASALWTNLYPETFKQDTI